MPPYFIFSGRFALETSQQYPLRASSTVLYCAERSPVKRIPPTALQAPPVKPFVFACSITAMPPTVKYLPR